MLVTVLNILLYSTDTFIYFTIFENTHLQTMKIRPLITLNMISN